MARPNRTPKDMQRYEVRTPRELVRRGAKDIERGLQDTECRGRAKPANCPPADRNRRRNTAR